MDTILDRIREVINDKTEENSVSEFARTLSKVRPKNSPISQQRLDKALKEKKGNKVPSVSTDIIEAILLSFPDIDAHELITGQKKSGSETEPDSDLLTQIEKDAERILSSLRELKKAPQRAWQVGTNVVQAATRKANASGKTKTDKKPKGNEI